MKNISKLIAGVISAAAGLALVVFDFVSRMGGSAALSGGNSMTAGGVAGIILLLAGGIAVISVLQSENAQGTGNRGNAGNANGRGSGRTEHISVPAEGSIEAKIIGITRNLRPKNGKEGFYVLCEYTDPATGVRETFTSEQINEYPGKKIIGRHVRVVFRNRDPENYTVDLDSIH